MRRREFIKLLSGAAASWPLAASAQQGERVRRIGAFISLAAGDAEGRARLTAFVQGLQDLGWNDGRNVRVDTRWSVGDAEGNRSYAAELVALTPDVILASGGTVMAPLHHATRTVPIVFTQVGDPVGAGFVESLARPGGNATGFTNFEYGIGAKWLELLKQIAPGVTRAAEFNSNLGVSCPLWGWARFNPWRRRSEWSYGRSTCARQARSSAPSRRSRALRMAA